MIPMFFAQATIATIHNDLPYGMVIPECHPINGL